MVRTYASKVIELELTFEPKERDIIDAEEIDFVKSVLELDGMGELELRNMRDMVVLIMNKAVDEAIVTNDSAEAMALMDMQSAVVGVIDHELSSKGFEV